MARETYIVTYDICDPKRLRVVYQTCRAFGEHIQYSVFRCDLSPLTRARLVAALDVVINHLEDQVLLIPLGPTDTNPDVDVESLGRPYRSRPRRVTIL
ncbi:MAG: CRISPR-associated endonuclease Cas2 [Deltaproteobacteria bacterium]|nr:CRISPR-associated endonuclease Cas2 [Deltaproteobacteria bacterium]